MKYRVKIQYPWTTYYEMEVEVEAPNVEEAEARAYELEKQADFWDKAYQVGDGYAGDSEVWSVSPAE